MPGLLVVVGSATALCAEALVAVLLCTMRCTMTRVALRSPGNRQGAVEQQLAHGCGAAAPAPGGGCSGPSTRPVQAMAIQMRDAARMSMTLCRGATSMRGDGAALTACAGTHIPSR